MLCSKVAVCFYKIVLAFIAGDISLMVPGNSIICHYYVIQNSVHFYLSPLCLLSACLLRADSYNEISLKKPLGSAV